MNRIKKVDNWIKEDVKKYLETELFNGEKRLFKSFTVVSSGIEDAYLLLKTRTVFVRSSLSKNKLSELLEQLKPYYENNSVDEIFTISFSTNDKFYFGYLRNRKDSFETIQLIELGLNEDW